MMFWETKVDWLGCQLGTVVSNEQETNMDIVEAQFDRTIETLKGQTVPIVLNLGLLVMINLGM